MRHPGNSLLLLAGIAGWLALYTPPEAKCAERALFDAKEYGAAGDGKTLDTPAINRAIEACSQAGGGTVVFPPGEYVTGTFVMLSRVTLRLEAGAVIKGSPNLADYQLKSEFNLGSRSGSHGEGLRLGLIVANQAEDIGIVGQGVIDGRGTYFVGGNTHHNPPDYRPSLTREGDNFMSVKSLPWEGPLEPTMPWNDRPGVLIVLVNCKHVTIRDVTLRDSHNWTLHLSGSEDVVISGIRILNNLLIPNNDGININAKNVRISDCYIEAGDDAIAANNCENLTVTNCTLISRSSAIRFAGGRYCTFQNVVIRDSNRGIGIYGAADHVLFSDILMQTRLFNGSWWGKGEPIYITARGGRGGPEGAAVTNVRFSNIIAEGEAGILVYGLGPGSIKDLVFDRLKLRLKGGPASAVVGGNFDLRSVGSSAAAGIVKHDIPAMYCQYVDGLQIRGFELEWADALPEYFTEAIDCEHFANLTIDGFVGRQASASGPGAAIALKDGDKVSVRASEAAPGTGTFLSLDSVKDLRSFVDNDLSHAREAISPAQSEFKIVTGNDLGAGVGQPGQSKKINP
jgi:hypothetical protein